MKDNMKFVEKIIDFLKNLFTKNNITMLNEGMSETKDDSKSEFVNNLKVKIVNKKKRKVETLTCVGDGLGIQNKISY